MCLHFFQVLIALSVTMATELALQQQWTVHHVTRATTAQCLVWRLRSGSANQGTTVSRVLITQPQRMKHGDTGAQLGTTAHAASLLLFLVTWEPTSQMLVSLVDLMLI